MASKDKKIPTPFGEFLRNLRFPIGETQKNMAKVLGVSPPFLSSVELGEKPIPEYFETTISDHYNLTEDQVNEMLHAIKISMTYARISLESLDYEERARFYDLMEKMNISIC